jgi:hypothetical protein
LPKLQAYSASCLKGKKREVLEVFVEKLESLRRKPKATQQQKVPSACIQSVMILFNKLKNIHVVRQSMTSYLKSLLYDGYIGACV